MKKACCLLMIEAIFLLTSCSFKGETILRFFQNFRISDNPLLGNDKLEADAQLEEIINACKNQDRNALKNLFSQKVLDEMPDIDNSIAELFEIFQCDDSLSYYGWAGPNADTGKNFDGTSRLWKRLRSTYDIQTSSQKYRIAIESVVIDTAYPDNVGIHSIYIMQTEASDLQYPYWGDGKWTPGINIYKDEN